MRYTRYLHLQRAASLNAPRGSRAPRYSARTVVSPAGEAAQAARQDLSPRPRRCGAPSFWSCGRGSRLAPVRQRKNTSSELLRRHREEDAASATAMARVRARAIVGAGTPTRGAAWRLARPRVAWTGPRTSIGTPGGIGMEFFGCNGRRTDATKTWRTAPPRPRVVTHRRRSAHTRRAGRTLQRALACASRRSMETKRG